MTTAFESYNPMTGEAIERYTDASENDVRAACAAAKAAAPALRDDDSARARLLRRAAARLRAAAERLHPVCHSESGLPPARLEGELERTCVQLELFASIVDDGSHVEAMIDTADPHAPIAPRPDVRRMLVPIGPVAVFGASNFPYAFSVAGGDTASALAAGCPVVVKAHPSHPGTSQLVAEEISGAVADLGLPQGTFALLQGASTDVARALVEADEIEAVGFTGSLSGGRALFDIAAARPRPIPVFAEMGSVNPIVVSEGALQARADAIADGLAASATNGMGQFCTKPGIVFVPEGTPGDTFVREVAARLDQVDPGPLLNERIHSAFRAAVAELEEDDGVELVTGARNAPAEGGGYLQAPVAYVTNAATVVERPSLLEERFGPGVVFVRYPDLNQVTDVLDTIGGQLTATLHAEAGELDELRAVVDRMQSKAGRLIFDGYPTGVAVTYAMQHGGPYPATSTPAHTSVGATAIRRWQRPVAWQNAPAALLPPALRDENPLGIWRLVNGEMTRAAISA
jgi:2,5-dioxopentanoate dehydrogenase